MADRKTETLSEKQLDQVTGGAAANPTPKIGEGVGAVRGPDKASASDGPTRCTYCGGRGCDVCYPY